jgi:hypothetical protein
VWNEKKMHEPKKKDGEYVVIYTCLLIN